MKRILSNKFHFYFELSTDAFIKVLAAIIYVYLYLRVVVVLYNSCNVKPRKQIDIVVIKATQLSILNLHLLLLLHIGVEIIKK